MTPRGPCPGLDRLEALRAVTEEDGTVRIFQEPEAKEGGEICRPAGCRQTT